MRFKHEYYGLRPFFEGFILQIIMQMRVLRAAALSGRKDAMEFRDALKMLRGELGITQMELANALHVNYSTVSRWELGKTLPNRSIATVLLDFARESCVAERCMDGLERSISDATKERLEVSAVGGLSTVEHAALCQIVDDATFPIYVSDLKTFELLYVNRSAAELIGVEAGELVGKKCYTCAMHRDSPCDFCHGSELVENRFMSFDAYRPFDGKSYRVQGKLIRWNGRRAQVRCITEAPKTTGITVARDREKNYYEHLRLMRRAAAETAVAMAHYNLTKNTVSDAESTSGGLLELLAAGTVDEVLGAIIANTLDESEQRRFDCAKDRSTLIKEFFAGNTHLSVRHHLLGTGRYYESTFDLMQNPSTFEIEAFAALRDVTEEALAVRVTDGVLDTYETVAVVDALTGETRLLAKERLTGERRSLSGSAAGIGAYLTEDCADSDISRVLSETGLDVVRRKLERKGACFVYYTADSEEGERRKRVTFTYLDSTRREILCTAQDITDICDEILKGKSTEKRS